MDESGARQRHLFCSAEGSEAPTLFVRAIEMPNGLASVSRIIPVADSAFPIARCGTKRAVPARASASNR